MTSCPLPHLPWKINTCCLSWPAACPGPGLGAQRQALEAGAKQESGQGLGEGECRPGYPHPAPLWTPACQACRMHLCLCPIRVTLIGRGSSAG